MSYEEKGVWVQLVVNVVGFVAYVVVIVSRADGGPLVDTPYVSTLLWVLGIAILSAIVLRITVEMVSPSESTRGDARDRDIGRYGEYVAGGVLGVGMLVPFGLTLAELDYFWIANAMYVVFLVSSLAGIGTKLVGYRRGYHRGL